MRLILEQLISAIKKKSKLNILYSNEKTSQEYNFVVEPYYLFKSGSNIYLLAFQESKNNIATYRVDKIKEVKQLPLFYNTNVKKLPEYLEKNTYFKSFEEVDITDKDIINSLFKEEQQYDDESSENKSYNSDLVKRVINYFIDCIKKEQTIEIKINLDYESKYYVIDSDYIVDMIKNEASLKLADEFKDYYKYWSKSLKYNPGLTIYFGYPIYQYNSNVYPIIYFAVKYNEQENSIIVQSDDVFINGSFSRDILGISNEEKEKLKKAIIADNYELIGEISQDIKDTFTSECIRKRGIIFLDKNNSANRGVLKELDKMKLKDILDRIPISSIFGGKYQSKGYEKLEHIYNIIAMNESQRAVVESINKPILLVQGPPGTGKTQTIVNIIANQVLKGKTVLISSNNNQAVTNIIEKFEKENLLCGMLRLGNRNYRRSTLENYLSKELDFQSNMYDIEQLTKDYNLNTEKSISLAKKINDLQSIERLFIEKMDLEEQLKRYIGELEFIHIGTDEIKETVKNITRKKRKNPYYSFLEILIDSRNQYVSYKLSVNKISHIIFSKLNKTDELHARSLKRQLRKIKISKDFINTKSEREEIISKLYVLEIMLRYKLTEFEIEQLKIRTSGYSLEEIKKELTLKNNEKITVDKELFKLKYTLNKLKIDEVSRKELLNKVQIILEKYKVEKDYNDREVFMKEQNNFYKTLLDMFPVILTTSQSVPSSVPIDIVFDTLIIDEASQCPIPSNLNSIYRARKMIIVGDDKQLGVFSGLNEDDDIDILRKHSLESYGDYYFYSKKSVFDLVNKITESSEKLLLNEHFRCQPIIANFANSHFYNDELIIKTEEIQGNYYGMKAINCQGVTRRVFGSRSIYNSEEIENILLYLKENYLELKEKSIGIITPFNMQGEKIKSRIKAITDIEVDLDKKKFYESIDIGTVYTVQGGEKKVIIFSSVVSDGVSEGIVQRTNKSKNLINVAITRAIDMFVMVGNMDFIKQYEGILKDLVIYIENQGNVQKAKAVRGLSEILKLGIYKDSVIKKIFNYTEDKIYSDLKEVILNFYMDFNVMAKVRVADVIDIKELYSLSLINFKDGEYGFKSHFDYVVYYIKNKKPLLVLEFDGPQHEQERQSKNDKIKDELCDLSGIKIRRIKAGEEITKDFLKEVISKYILI